MSDILVEYFSPRFELLGITPFASEVSTTWVHNDIGTATLSFPRSTPNFDKIVQPGNIYRINRQGVIPWIGSVDPSRTWKRGAVTLQCKSAENLLRGHLTPQGAVTSDTKASTARSFFESAVQRNSWTPLRAGAFTVGGYVFGQYDYVDLFTIYQEFAGSGGAFWVDSNLAVNFTNSRGLDKTASVVLYEDIHVTVSDITENYADVVTHLVALGEGNDIISKVKKLRQVQDSTRFFAKVEDFRGVVAEEELRVAADQYLQANSQPVITIDTTILNVNDIWSSFGMGDTIQLVLNTRAPSGEKFFATVFAMELQSDNTLRCLFTAIPQTVSQTQDWTII